MAFSDNLSLDDASGDLVAYSKIASSGDRIRRLDTSTTLAESRLMEIAHNFQGSGADIVDRHLVSFSHTQNNATGKPRKAIVNLTVSIPRDAVVTPEDVDDLIANLVDFITGGSFGDSGFGSTATLRALYRGEA